MKKFLLTISLICFCLIFNQMKTDAMGLFYTNATYPITATGATANNLDKLKKGSVSTTNILFCVELGDASIDKAAKKAGINKISYIDVNEKSVFIFWRKVTVNVYGE